MSANYRVITTTTDDSTKGGKTSHNHYSLDSVSTGVGSASYNSALHPSQHQHAVATSRGGAATSSSLPRYARPTGRSSSRNNMQQNGAQTPNITAAKSSETALIHHNDIKNRTSTPDPYRWKKGFKDYWGEKEGGKGGYQFRSSTPRTYIPKRDIFEPAVVPENKTDRDITAHLPGLATAGFRSRTPRIPASNYKTPQEISDGLGYGPRPFLEDDGRKNGKGTAAFRMSSPRMEPGARVITHSLGPAEPVSSFRGTIPVIKGHGATAGFKSKSPRLAYKTDKEINDLCYYIP